MAIIRESEAGHEYVLISVMPRLDALSCEQSCLIQRGGSIEPLLIPWDFTLRSMSCKIQGLQ